MLLSYFFYLNYNLLYRLNILFWCAVISHLFFSYMSRSIFHLYQSINSCIKNFKLGSEFSTMETLNVPDQLGTWKFGFYEVFHTFLLLSLLVINLVSFNLICPCTAVEAAKHYGLLLLNITRVNGAINHGMFGWLVVWGKVWRARLWRWLVSNQVPFGHNTKDFITTPRGLQTLN